MQCTLLLEVVLVTVFILFSVSARKLDSNGLLVNDTDILRGDAVKYGEMELEELKTELMEMEEMETKEKLGGHIMELEDTWLEESKTELLEKEEMEAERKLFGRRLKSQSSRGYSPIGFVVQVAPKLRFDSKFGSEDKCFPSSAESYYIARASGNNNRICNTDYSTMTGGNVPTYWRAMECGDDLNIAFWFFSGYQDTCSPGQGSHDSDWEHIVVKVEDYKSSRPTLGPVQFYQHGGWYTKNPGHYSRDGVHPIVYSGKNSHGSYHDDGGSGGCFYWEDFRNPGSKDQHMKTWLNLEELRRTDSAPSFMQDLSSKEKFGMKSPLDRKETYEMCMLPGCKGSTIQYWGESGCSKSQVDDDTFF